MSDEKDSAKKDEPGERDEEPEGSGAGSDGAGEGADGAASEDAPEEPDGAGEEGEEEGDLEADPLASADDAIDPDLLALGERQDRPKWHRPIVMVAVLALIVVMMVWFRLELTYFFSSEEPLDLGDAHEVELGPELENRFVRLDGMPLAPRNMNPSAQCGQMQGFPTYQRRFLCRGHQSAIPLMGRPEHDLLVQRYLVRQLRVSYLAPEDRREETLELAERAVRRVSAVHEVRRTGPDEIGQLVAEIQGRSGRTDLSAVRESIRFQLESSVPGIRAIRVERVNRDAPGSFEGRVVRVENLGRRFGAVADYFNECTDFNVTAGAYVVLDGSEAGDGAWSTAGMCYGQAPRQYWPYLLLYIILAVLFVLNVYLLLRFLTNIRKKAR